MLLLTNFVLISFMTAFPDDLLITPFALLKSLTETLYADWYMDAFWEMFEICLSTYWFFAPAEVWFFAAAAWSSFSASLPDTVFSAFSRFACKAAAYACALARVSASFADSSFSTASL